MAKDKPMSNVERLYRDVREMAISFRFKPGERLNEVMLATRFKSSRTPLREALNRLVAEGFLTFQKGRGFFCRELTPGEMFELYQLRGVLEVAAVRLACEMASDDDLDELREFLDKTGPETDGRGVVDLVALDEHFHETIMGFAGNREMSRVLANINARIKFCRWIDMAAKRGVTQAEHRAILDALRGRDPARAGDLMAGHIARRLDQIKAALKEGYSQIYLSA